MNLIQKIGSLIGFILEIITFWSQFVEYKNLQKLVISVHVFRSYLKLNAQRLIKDMNGIFGNSTYHIKLQLLHLVQCWLCKESEKSTWPIPQLVLDTFSCCLSTYCSGYGLNAQYYNENNVHNYIASTQRFLKCLVNRSKKVFL